LSSLFVVTFTTYIEDSNSLLGTFSFASSTSTFSSAFFSVSSFSGIKDGLLDPFIFGAKASSAVSLSSSSR